MYILADGSGIGMAIYLAIATNDTKEAKKVSDNINTAINKIRSLLESKGIEVIFAGGDDIFCEVKNQNQELVAISIIKDIFKKETSFNMDVATGETPLEAATNLDKLKTKKRLEKLNVGI